MSTRSPVALVENAWTLIYDAAVTGDFVGMASTSSQLGVALTIAGSPPAAGFLGSFFGLQQAISLSKSAGDKLYARPLAGLGFVTLDSGLLSGAMPVGLFGGFRAMTTQGYTEANVKMGTQFYIQYNVPQLAANTQHKISFVTGAKKVVVKARDFYALGQFVNIQVFKQPTITAATGAPIDIQNFNDVNPVASTVSMRGGVTATVNGTAWGSPQRLFGANTAGQRVGQTLPPGGERVLKPNSSYLIVVSNTDTGGSSTADADYFLTWYEGDTDLPAA